MRCERGEAELADALAQELRVGIALHWLTPRAQSRRVPHAGHALQAGFDDPRSQRSPDLAVE